MQLASDSRFRARTAVGRFGALLLVAFGCGILSAQPTITPTTTLLVNGAIITNCTNTTPAVVTTSAAHGFATGQRVNITGVVGNTNCNVANNVITELTATTFRLTVNGNAAYVSGGRIETDNGFWVDGDIVGNKPPEEESNYAGYKITNNGTARADVWVRINNFGPGVTPNVHRASNEDGLYRIGGMAANEMRMAYFYLTSGAGVPILTTVDQTHDIAVYEGNPTSGGVLLAGPSNYFYRGVIDVTQAASNKVDITITTPNPPNVGGTMTMTVHGNTGVFGGSGDFPNLFAAQPATCDGCTGPVDAWVADTFKLLSAVIRIGNAGNDAMGMPLGACAAFGGGGLTITDDLTSLLPFAPSNCDYEIIYSFRIAKLFGQAFDISPVNFFNSSGTNQRHTDRSGLLPPIQAALATVILTKSASPTAFTMGVGGVVTYTITIDNTGGNSEANLINLVDVLPTSPASATCVSGCAATYSGGGTVIVNTSGLPTVVFSKAGGFSVPIGTTRTLTYQVNIPNNLGTYVNSAVGHVDTVQIDTTADTTDNMPAMASVTVSVPMSNLRVEKADTVDPLTAVDGTTTYNVVVTNGGPDSAASVVLMDTLTITHTNGGPPPNGVVIESITLSPLPSGCTDMGMEPSLPSCCSSNASDLFSASPGSTNTGKITCNLGTMANAAAITLSYVMRARTNIVVADGMCDGGMSDPTINNSAMVSSNTADPTPGNNTDTESTCVVNTTAIELSGLNAYRSNGRNAITWRTSREVSNLGFHVYREAAGQRQRITRAMIAGSALTAGPDTAFTAGRGYSWWDVDGPEGAVYWLEEFDLYGGRAMHGPVSLSGAAENDPSVTVLTTGPSGEAPNVTLNGKPAPNNGGSRLLSDLGRGGSSALSAGPALSTGGLGRVSRSRGPSDAERLQGDLAAGAGVQIWVNRSGWHRIPMGDLRAAGLDANVSVASLRLYTNGVEEALWVAEDGSAVGFFGRESDSVFSDGRVYWLVPGAPGGKRVLRGGDPNAGVAANTSFPYRIERAERPVYFSGILNGDESNFFSAVIADDAVEQKLTVRNLDGAGGDALLEVSFQGVTVGEHGIRVLLNGQLLQTVEFAARQAKSATIPVALSLLVEGDNTIRLERTGGIADVSLLDTLALTYPHLYRADDDRLWFTAAGGSAVTVAGFSSGSVRVFDVTDPRNASELLSSIAAAGGGFAVRVTASGAGERSLVAVTDLTGLEPTRLLANSPSEWRRGRNQAEYVVISHGTFIDALGPLRTLRESENLSVAVIDAQDLYDEYSFGQKSPHAIRDFFLEARRWDTAPRYAVLVGDATFDPKNLMGQGSFDFVPTKMVDTRAFETASDDWFTDFDGDRVADIPIGRLPVRTLSEANTVVSKLVGYARAEGGAWSGSALLVADNPDNFDFAAASRALGSRLPNGVSANYVNLNPAATAQSRSELLDALNGGQLLVNYTGHGGPDVWAQENLFSSASALALRNGDRLPFVTALSCMNGLFHDVFGDSLAESLLKAPNGGAIAIWSSSGLTAPQFQLEAATALYDALFRQNSRLGDAVRSAKAAASDPDVRATWNLIGDPATKLREGGR